MFRIHSSADVSVRTLSSIAAHCDVEDYILYFNNHYNLSVSVLVGARSLGRLRYVLVKVKFALEQAMKA